MANRKRPIVLRCPVTAEERALIEQKMAQLPTQRIGAYLRKMAIDGYIIYTDTADIKAFTKELSAIGRNINQIAKRINAGGPAYQADMDEIRERLDEIWQLQKTHPIKRALKAAIDYICNPEKTDGKLLVSSYGCVAETADINLHGPPPRHRQGNEPWSPPDPSLSA